MVYLYASAEISPTLCFSLYIHCLYCNNRSKYHISPLQLISLNRIVLHCTLLYTPSSLIISNFLYLNKTANMPEEIRNNNREKNEDNIYLMLVRLLCKLVLLCILIISKLLSRFWCNFSFDGVTGVSLTRGLTSPIFCRQLLVENQYGTREKRLFLSSLCFQHDWYMALRVNKCVCVYEKLILLRVGLTGAEDPGQDAKAVLAFAKSGAPRDYFTSCLWPVGHLPMFQGGW